jgi:hypothetical protein
MRTGVIVDVSPADRERLAAIAVDRNSPQKHAWRARIVLLSSEGCGTAEILREAGVAKTAVWRWQERFMQEGVDGLLRDKTRPSRIPPLAPEIAESVVALTIEPPPGETTHWTALVMAKAVGISVLKTPLIFSSPTSCVDSRRFPTKPRNFLDDLASCKRLYLNHAMAGV